MGNHRLYPARSRVRHQWPKYSEATVRGNIVSTRCFIDMFLLLLLRDPQGFTAPWHDTVR